MVPNQHDQETIRRYLLGQLTDAEEESVEERLLNEEDFFEELEITKDELIEEYQSKHLTSEEREWFERNFLASPEGEQRQAFARTLSRYVSAHLPIPQKKLTWTERLTAFSNSQLSLVRAAAVMAIVLIVVGIFWVSLVPSPQSFATLTLTSSSSTRSTGTESPKVKLKEDALRLTLTLPTPAPPEARYRVELINDKGEIKTSEVIGHDAQSVAVDIPAVQLTRGPYAIRLSIVGTDGNAQRIPGSYYFTIE